MKNQAMIAALLGPLMVTGAFAQEPKKQEPGHEEYQEQVLKQLPDQEDPVAKDPHHIGDLEEGTPAPDKYWRESYRIKDLKKHNLPPPEEQEQWVKIGTDYVLLNTNSGTIQRIIKGE